MSEPKMKRIKAGGVSLPAFQATPESGQGPGVLVLHAWWGLNPFIRDLCTRLAGEGFVALAPDPFHGKTASTIEQAERLSSRVRHKQVGKEILVSFDHLRRLRAVTGERAGVVGFSWGAAYALWLAEQRPKQIAACVFFYGTRGGEGSYAESEAAFLGHFAAEDPYESADAIRGLDSQLSEAKKAHALRLYPDTGHWFFESDRPDAYHPRAARQAWKETVKFLKSHLGAPG